MSIILKFLGGAVAYSLAVIISYSDVMKKSIWFIPLGVLASVIAGSLWMSIAKYETNSSSLLLKGLYWDVMILLSYLIIPLIFFNARLTMNQSIGLVLILVGLILTKI